MNQFTQIVQVHEPVVTSQTFFTFVVQCKNFSMLIFYRMTFGIEILIIRFIPFTSFSNVLTIFVDGIRLNMTTTNQHECIFEDNIDVAMIISDFGQKDIEIRFSWDMMYDIIQLLNESLLTMVASTVEVELINIPNNAAIRGDDVHCNNSNEKDEYGEKKLKKGGEESESKDGKEKEDEESKNDDGSNKDDKKDKGKKEKTALESLKSIFFDEDESDSKLHLSDILNTLDGLCERTGQRVVWTTNKAPPQKHFDPAFLRPGRMDMIIKLGECTHQGIDYLLKRYYHDDDDDTNHVNDINGVGIIGVDTSVTSGAGAPPSRTASGTSNGLNSTNKMSLDLFGIDEGRFTPAQIKQICKESSCLKDALQMLRDICSQCNENESETDMNRLEPIVENENEIKDEDDADGVGVDSGFDVNIVLH